MSTAAILGAMADFVSATLCFSAPLVLARLLNTRECHGYRQVFVVATITACLRGLMHVSLLVDTWYPIPTFVSIGKLLAACALAWLAWVIYRQVSLFFVMLDRAEKEHEYVAIVGILQRLRSQARRHDHPRDG